MKADAEHQPFGTRLGSGRSSRVSGAGVTVADDHVVKVVENVDAVAEKYAAFYRLGQRFSFHAPSVLSVDRAAGALHLERIFYAASLRDLYSDAIYRSEYREMEGLLFTVGRALANIHLNLTQEAAVDWVAPTTLKNRLSEYGYNIDHSPPVRRAILHGDFGYSNLFLRTDGQLVILDPCPDGIVTHGCWERAPVYVDIGRMLSCLEGAALPLRAIVRLNTATICRMQRTFLDGYRDVANFPVEDTAAFAFGYAIMMEQAAGSKGVGSIVKPALRYNRLVRRNFPLKRKLKYYGRANLVRDDIATVPTYSVPKKE
ncbi:MAG: hypothetical protein EON58_00805 [Alphaproteobacteria bacterium]|nr:MAG: hypothetical protein EON58_00805 [Alphaproteobacteria bacterium]